MSGGQILISAGAGDDQIFQTDCTTGEVVQARVATKILRKFLVGLVKESIVEGEGLFKNLLLRGLCSGLFKPNVFCMSMLRSMVITDQLACFQ